MLIPESLNSLQVPVLDLMSMFVLRYLDLFFVIQLITDVMTINRPGMVDDLIPSFPRLICSLFLAIVKYMVSQGTAQPLVIVI